MTPLATFISLSKDTFGGIPAVLVVNLLQLTTCGWVVRELVRAKWEQQRYRDDAVLKIRSAHRAEIWRTRVRPVVITLMLLGPGLGLAMSTLVGALGMGALGDAMASQVDQQTLLAQIGGAYKEISHAYLLMVGGTAPMLLGPILILIARRFERDASVALGGDPQDRMLCAVERIVELLERQQEARG
jgi:hypothetical protein